MVMPGRCHLHHMGCIAEGLLQSPALDVHNSKDVEGMPQAASKMSYRRLTLAGLCLTSHCQAYHSVS